jgi:phospholipase/lecithinase/hemolysin
MKNQTRRSLIALVVGLILAAAPAVARNKADLSRLVVVGDSLSAGFQNGSLLSTQQVNGYAARIASQAHSNLVLPLVAAPGIPNVIVLTDPGPPPQTERAPGASMGRTNPAEQATNLAVPGAKIADLLSSRPDFDFLDMTDLVLGLPGAFTGTSKSQVEWAETLAPTTIILWAGNMDVLDAACSGDPALITPLADFEASYRAVADRLASTGAALVFANIPDVTTVAYLTTAEHAAAMIGAPLSAIGPVLGIEAGDYLTPEAFGVIPQILAGTSAGPLPPGYVLSRDEVAQVRHALRSFNKVIATVAREKRAALVDTNELTSRLYERGYVVGGQRLTTNFLGGLYSLDGVHPTNTGYAIIANEFIRVMNWELAGRIPPVSIEQVKAGDPLVLPGVGHPPGHVHADAARSLKAVLRMH